jgi:glycosyltransferase involved in cell wall biosynthesis
MMNPSIEILLPTYNGEQFVGALIDSLMSQTYQNWRLLIRDDGSRDGTARIVRAYAHKYPDRISAVEDGDGNLGVIRNVQRLLERAASGYVMFCDQDDVWLPHKIDVTFEKMTALEGAFGQNTPILVHTDAKVVDADLREIARSLWRYQKSDPGKGSTLNRLLLQNVATGCTVMVNKALLKKALPFPDEAMMHDWWLALVAAAFGRADRVPESTLLYRQHGKNDTGAKQWNLAIGLRNVTNVPEFLRSLRDSKKITFRLEQQSDIFLRRFFDVLSDEGRNMLASFSHLSSRNYLMRRYYMLKYRFFYTDPLRNIGRLLFA